MKPETYDTLMELWDLLLQDIADYQELIMENLVDIPFREEYSKTQIIDKIMNYTGRITGIEDVCERIRIMTKHAEIQR